MHLKIIERSCYKGLINEIEQNYDVQEWMHNEYHIWPVLRVRLFLKLVAEFEESSNGKKEKTDSFKNYFDKIASTYNTWKDYKTFSNRNVSKLYCGAPSHRVDYLGKQYNRYFDYLMDEDKDEENLLIEYKSNNKVGFYKPERVFLFDNFARLFKIYSKRYRVDNSSNEFVKKLDRILKDLGYDVRNIITDLSQMVGIVDRSLLIFSKILENIEPKEIYELCYYSPSMLGLNIAADKMGIPTIDMQHGPQGKYHLAYGSWTSVPDKGYEALPDKFYTWDSSSANSINEWANSTEKHSAIFTGNPWVKGWKNKEFVSSKFDWPSKLVLYTLQPIGNPLDEYILQAIELTKSRWNWWLRIHPRQLSEMPRIKEKLKTLNLLDYVNIEDATTLPLPEILSNTKMHLTKFSGCAIEAYSFGTPTLLLDERGKKSFNQYLHDELMKLCLEKNSKKLIDEISKWID